MTFTRILRQFLLRLPVAIGLLTTTHAALSADRLVVDPKATSAAHATVVYRHALPRIGAPARAAASTHAPSRMTAMAAAPRPFVRGRSTTLSTNRTWPADLPFEGGPMMKQAASHMVYFDPSGTCDVPTCWGDPEGFLKDLSTSDFIHVVDGYIGAFQPGRYTVGGSFTTATPATNFLTDADVQAIVYAAARTSGQTGYGHIYHVLLAPGVDECFDSTRTVCYSPDNLATFYYCGYHADVDFADIGHVVYTLVPYANVLECQVPADSPNGPLVDSIDGVLSHELFETITDPAGTAWRTAPNFGVFQGEVTDGTYYDLEVADLCHFSQLIDGQYYVEPMLITLGSRVYALPLEYSNRVHGCVSAPS